MPIVLAHIIPVAGRFEYRAVFTQGGQVVGTTLVAGHTVAQARAAALAILARINASQS
jgi:hypothetical protein